MCAKREENSFEIDSQSKQVIARLKEEREKARLSQMDLSLRAGLSQNLVNYIESGKRTPSLNTLLRLCKALRIEPSVLFATPDLARQEARETIVALVRKWV
jgi:transcriptional regulator with XRE-family HTH domain